MLDPSLLPMSDGIRSLRPLAAKDAERFVEGAQDPLVEQFGHLPEPDYSPESVKRLANREVPAGLERGNLALLSIVDATADDFLGSLVLFDVTADSAELGFWLHPRARGAGHAIGAIELAATFAHGSGLHELTARTVIDNDASKFALERGGFQEVARDVDQTPSGEHTRLIHYRRVLRS